MTSFFDIVDIEIMENKDMPADEQAVNLNNIHPCGQDDIEEMS